MVGWIARRTSRGVSNGHHSSSPDTVLSRQAFESSLEGLTAGTSALSGKGRGKKKVVGGCGGNEMGWGVSWGREGEG